jgi:predicted methyltransferase
LAGLEKEVEARAFKIHLTSEINKRKADKFFQLKRPDSVCFLESEYL